MGKISFSLLIFILLSAFQLNGQNRYVVFFTDKDNTPYSIGAPQEYLSAKALERRNRQNIAVNRDDLPVDPAYVNGLKNTGAAVYYLSKWMNAAVIQADAALVAQINALTYVDAVVLAAPGAKLSRKARELQEEQTLGEDSEFQLAMVGLDRLHQQNIKGQGILMAVFDGGFIGVDQLSAFQHIYDDNRVLYTMNMVANDNQVYQYSSHGTRVLSVIAGLVPGQFTGGAYEADYMLFVTEENNSEYRIEEYNWLIAAEKADSAGVDIISSSLGYYDFLDASMNYEYADLDGLTTVITRAVNFATARGMMVVTSAGNEGNKTWHYITAPADAFDVISVGSVDSAFQISSFSSVGPSADGRIKPDVVALGQGIFTISQTGAISAGSNGTSFSCPLVSSLAAALWQQNPTLTALEVRSLIVNEASRHRNPDNSYGNGIPGVQYIVSGIPGTTQPLTLYPNPMTGDVLHIKSAGFTDAITGIIYDRMGRQVSSFMANKIASGYQPVSLMGLKPGIYLIELRTNDKRHLFKIVKY